MRNTYVRIALATVTVAAAVALSGCSLLNQFNPASQPVRDADTGEVTEEVENADVFAVRVGDCMNTSEVDASSEVSDVPVVPCAEPHEDEVYYAYDLAEGEYPGEEAIKADAEATCVPEFTTFVGLAYEESVLDYWPMYPTAGSWDSGDREVLCVVWDPSGAKVTGSVQGAAR